MASKILTWILFYSCTAVAAGGSFWFVGTLNPNNLIQPAIAPPAWLFAPVWTTLYLMIATSGFFLAVAEDHQLKPVALGLWGLQMCLNTLWTPVFFGAFDLWGAFYIICALWLSITAYVAVSFVVERKAGYLFLPYWAWVSFASVLNYGYIVVNVQA